MKFRRVISAFVLAPEKGGCENSPKIFEYNNLLCNARVLNSVLELYSFINIFVEYIHLQYTIQVFTMSRIAEAVRRTLSLSRAQSPEPDDPVQSTRRTRERTLNPDEVNQPPQNDRVMPGSRLEEFCERVRVFLRKGHKVKVQAEWSEQGDDFTTTVTGTVKFRYRDKSRQELRAEWDDCPGTGYPFPHPRILYYDLDIVKVEAKMPDGEVLEPGEEEIGSLQISDPREFSAVRPRTWGPWINSQDEFKPRELVRELREYPQFGVRFNPPPHRERIFKILTEWIYAARELETWDDGHFVKVAEMLIEELRNAYWAPRASAFNNR